MSTSKYSKYIIQQLKAPFSAEVNAAYSKVATRKLWMDENVVPGAFQMSFSWYRKPFLQGPPPHTHEADEILGFFGDDPNNLHGEVEMWMGDQKNMLTKSTLLFAPSGMSHCPLIIHRVNRPIFHFSVVIGGTYRSISIEGNNNNRNN
jgi:hypothetical protein